MFTMYIKGLYVITDPALQHGSHAEVVYSALRGGADVIQLRDKEAGKDELVHVGRQLLQICRAFKKPLIINDHVDVALMVGAHGVHLGQTDRSLRSARGEFSGIIGVTAHTLEEALCAALQGADYVALSPIYATQTKADAGEPCGPELIAEIKREVSIPVVAIGGINRGNVREVVRAGADAIAVVSSVVGQPDVERAAREMKRAAGF